MAKRKSMPAAHSSRKRRPRSRSNKEPASGVAAAAQHGAHAIPESLHTAIELTRTKLMRARAVLDCIRYVLLYDDPGEGNPKLPSFCDAIDVPRSLLDEAINDLDRVHLRPAQK